MKNADNEDMNPALKLVEIGNTASKIFNGILDEPMKSLKEQLEFIKENKFGHVWEYDDDRHRKVMRDINTFLHAVTDSFSSKHAEAAKHIEGSTCDSFLHYLHEKLNESLLSQHPFQDSWEETQDLIGTKILQIKNRLEAQHDEQPKQQSDLEIMILDTKLFDPIHIYHALLCCQVVRDCEDPEYRKDSLANLEKEHLLTELSVSYEHENVPKYLMARCGNVLYVCFQGVQAHNFGGTEKSYRGEICAGISNVAKKIPLKYFGREIILNNRIVFTGHSSGGAVASLVSTFLLEKFKNQKEKFLKSRIKCITFGLMPFGNSSFKSFVEAIPGARDCFCHIVQKKDIVPKLFGSFNMKNVQAKLWKPLKNILKPALKIAEKVGNPASAKVARVFENLIEEEMFVDAVFSLVGLNHLDIFGTYYILDTSNEGQFCSVKSSEEATTILKINDDEGLRELHSQYLTNHQLERYVHEVEIAFTDGKLPDMKKFKTKSSAKMVQDITPKVTEVIFENFGKEVIAKITGKNMWFVHNVSIEGLNNDDGENADRKDLKVNLNESLESEVQATMGKANIRIEDEVRVNVKTHFDNSIYLEQFTVPAKESTYPVTRRQQQLAKLSPQEVIELAFLSAVLEHRSETQQSKRFEAIKAFLETAISVVPLESIFHAMVNAELEVVLQCCEIICSSDALQTLPIQSQDSLSLSMRSATMRICDLEVQTALEMYEEDDFENEQNTKLEEQRQLFENTNEVIEKLCKYSSSDVPSSYQIDLAVVYPSADDKDKRKPKVTCCKTPMALLREGKEKLNRLSKKLISEQSDATEQKMSSNTNIEMLSVLTNLRKEFKTCGTLLGAFMESQVQIPLENVRYGKYFKQLAEQAGFIGLSLWALLILPFQYLYRGIIEPLVVEFSLSKIPSGARKHQSSKHQFPDYDERLGFLVASMKKSATCNQTFISYSLERQLEDQCKNRHISHHTSVDEILKQWTNKFKDETLTLVPDEYRRLVARWIKWSLMINHLRESLASQTAIGVIGLVNSGKSTFVKSLFEHETITGTTAQNRTTVPLIYNMGHIIEGVDVIDFPGVDDSDESIPDLAKLLLSLTRIIVFVIDYRRAHVQSTEQWLSILDQENVPVLICLTFADKLFAETMKKGGGCNIEEIKRLVQKELKMIKEKIGQPEGGHQRDLKMTVFSFDNDSTLNDDKGKENLRKVGLKDELDVGRWIAEKLDDDVGGNFLKFINGKKESTLNSNWDLTGQPPAAKKRRLDEEKRLNDERASSNGEEQPTCSKNYRPP